MRKRFWTLAVGTILAVSAFGFGACGEANKDSSAVDGEKEHTVTVANVGASIALKVKHSEPVTFQMFCDEYYKERPQRYGDPMFDGFFTDQECRTRYVNESVTEDITLYVSKYNLGESIILTFVYRDEAYSVCRNIGQTITAEDFSRSAYGHGTPEDYAFYSDEEMTTPFQIEGYELSAKDWYSLKIYVADKN